MVSLTALWLPILLSAVFVFLLSSVLHMVLTYHYTDFKGVPNEDAVMDALRPLNIPPGEYVIPHASSPKMSNSEEFKAKVEKGPFAMLTMWPSGMPSMGKSLALWFVYSLIVGLFAGYIGSRAVPTDGHYLDVFRFVGTSAFMGYALALMQNSIWYKRSWTTTSKSMFDGLLYALVTAGTFGWLWP